MPSATARATDVSQDQLREAKRVTPAQVTTDSPVATGGYATAAEQSVVRPLVTRMHSSETDSGKLPFDPRELRAANRAVTRQTLAPQLDELAKKRMVLFRKARKQELSTQEARELRFVEWQLQRIEDAEIGDQVDRLESLAIAHERLQETVGNWIDAVKAASNRPRRDSSPR